MPVDTSSINFESNETILDPISHHGLNLWTVPHSWRDHAVILFRYIQKVNYLCKSSVLCAPWLPFLTKATIITLGSKMWEKKVGRNQLIISLLLSLWNNMNIHSILSLVQTLLASMGFWMPGKHCYCDISQDPGSRMLACPPGYWGYGL